MLVGYNMAVISQGNKNARLLHVNANGVPNGSNLYVNDNRGIRGLDINAVDSTERSIKITPATFRVSDLVR